MEQGNNTKEEEDRIREQLDRIDEDWEQQRRTDLGTDAILGPKSSPQKRMRSAPQGARKRRRKTPKYPTIGEDWGEQEQTPL